MKMIKCKTLQPVSTGKSEKGQPTEFYEIGSIIELPENDFEKLQKGGYVERSAPAAKVEEKPQLGKAYNEENRKKELVEATKKASKRKY